MKNKYNVLIVFILFCKTVTLYFKVSLLHMLHLPTIMITIMHNYAQVTLSQTLILTLTI